MRPLVLFDLDGTVLTFDGAPPGPGRSAMRRAMRDLVGADDATAGVRFAGCTDQAIVRAMLERTRGGAIDPILVKDAIARYLVHLEDEVVRRPYRRIGDVAACVAALDERGAVVAIGTGNVREGAAIKLRSAGLDAVFELDRGGYGCDAEDRPGLLRAAVERCRDEAFGAVVVIGDTEHDVSAARAIGAKVVGVAASESALDELRRAGADAIVADCGLELVEALFRVANA
jgi:phosphoglycolate phosphatase-like HAD superfamily hydrolase